MNNNFKYIKEEIEKEIQNCNISGASVCIIKDGKEIYKDNFGFADKENNIKMADDTIFRMFSTTKPITATAIMILFERGKIDLYDPVSMYLEGFKNQKVIKDGKLSDVNREMTIKDLLNMTSGLSYADDSTECGKCMSQLFDDVKRKLEEGSPINTLDFCNAIGKVPLAFQPGDQWLYGTSADILGAIVEVVSKKKFSEFLSEEIFKPLDMKDTAFYVPEEKRPRFAQIYKYNEEEKRLYPYLEDALGLDGYKVSTAFESGGAGLVSTINDYKKFALMLLNKGKYEDTRILGSKTVEFMTQNQLNEKQMQSMNWESLRGYGYGNLMRILINQAEGQTNGSLGEFGWDGWTGNYITISPKDNMIFMYFIQRCDTGTSVSTRKLRSIVYSAINY